MKLIEVLTELGKGSKVRNSYMAKGSYIYCLMDRLMWYDDTPFEGSLSCDYVCGSWEIIKEPMKWSAEMRVLSLPTNAPDLYEALGTVIGDREYKNVKVTVEEIV